MSVIRKKPFIQTLVEDLTEAQKASLLGVMNGSGSTEEVTFGDLPEDAIAPVLFKFSEVDSKTGILIQSDNYTVLIAYHRFQDLLMFKINSNNTYEKINEYLDINELRNLLEDSGDVVIGDDLAVGGKLEVTGTSEFKDSAEFKDDVEFKGDISIANDSELKAFENIVDKDGHKRFVEGDCQIQTANLPEGMEITYDKWSLSGTVLMLTVEGSVASGVVVPSAIIVKAEIPSWIASKIRTVFNEWIMRDTVVFWNSDFTNQSVTTFLGKEPEGKLKVTFGGTFTADKDRKFRIAFNLLIDND